MIFIAYLQETNFFCFCVIISLNLIFITIVDITEFYA